jgi:hypothetical protein
MKRSEINQVIIPFCFQDDCKLSTIQGHADSERTASGDDSHSFIASTRPPHRRQRCVCVAVFAHDSLHDDEPHRRRRSASLRQAQAPKPSLVLKHHQNRQIVPIPLQRFVHSHREPLSENFYRVGDCTQFKKWRDRDGCDVQGAGDRVQGAGWPNWSDRRCWD